MASGLGTPLGIAGIIFVIIGVIMAIVGVVLLIAQQNQSKPWYIWFLIIAGIVFVVAGGIMMAIALSSQPAVDCYTGCDVYGRPIPANTRPPPGYQPAPATLVPNMVPQSTNYVIY